MHRPLAVSIGVVVCLGLVILALRMVSIWTKLHKAKQDPPEQGSLTRRLVMDLVFVSLCGAVSLAYLGILVYLQCSPVPLTRQTGYVVGCLGLGYLLTLLMKCAIVRDIFKTFASCPSYYPRLLIGLATSSSLARLAFCIWTSIILSACIGNISSLSNNGTFCRSTRNLAIFGYIEAVLSTLMYSFVGISPIDRLWKLQAPLPKRVVICIGFLAIAPLSIVAIISSVYVGRALNRWQGPDSPQNSLVASEILVWDSIHTSFVIFLASFKYIIKGFVDVFPSVMQSDQVRGRVSPWALYVASRVSAVFARPSSPLSSTGVSMMPLTGPKHSSKF